MMTSDERLIVALDEPNPGSALRLAGELAGTVRWVKVGLALFGAGGRGLVRDLVSTGWRVFLDLKLHDIPFQVARAIEALSDLGVNLLTVHTAGGAAMLEAAVRAAEGSGIRIVGVTVLTSLDGPGLAAVGVSGSPAAVVLARARLAIGCGLAGVVASAQEASALRAELGLEPEIITPGIRLFGAVPDDQRRVATPADAIRRGASRLVVGRPITQAPAPAAAARAILESLA